MAGDMVWVWFGDDRGIQHLAEPPDDVTMQWEASTACGLDGSVRRVTFENVDRGISCKRCTAKPYTLAGKGRGPA